MGKYSKSSRRWLVRQHEDDFTSRAKSEGYRSRAVYKLLEIQQKDKIFSPGMTVVDLGAAPGGWSQLAREYVGSAGRVVAVDILPMESIAGVDIITGDFCEQSTCDQLTNLLSGAKVDVVISDMAPNFSGISDVDQPRAVYLAELGLDFAQTVLVPGGVFLVKLFQGKGFVEYVQLLKNLFSAAIIRKPKASRHESREVYVLAKKFSMVK